VYYELATQKQAPRPAGLPCSTDQTNRSHAPIDRWSPARSLVGFVRVPLPHAATAERARARRARISARDQVVERGGQEEPEEASSRCTAGRFGNGFWVGAPGSSRAIKVRDSCGVRPVHLHARPPHGLAMMIDRAHTQRK